MGQRPARAAPVREPAALLAQVDEAEDGVGEVVVGGELEGVDAGSSGPPPAMGREAPMSLGRLQEGAESATGRRPAEGIAGDEVAFLREEIRRMVLEELRGALGSHAGTTG